MAKKQLSIKEALELYRAKKNGNLKTSWGIFKKRMTTQDFRIFKNEIEALYGKD